MAISDLFEYHRRTKHHPGRFARSAGYMDWDNQPDPFRTYRGAPRVALRTGSDEGGPDLDQLGVPGAVDAAPAELDMVARLLFHSLALSAWKAHASGARWSLRCNPSSGNLHPTEGWVICGDLAGLEAGSGIYHYSPLHHELEQRRPLSAEQFDRLTRHLPPGALILALSSIHWREAWKYGERAFRYCNHDVGHALAAVALSAAALGWRAAALPGLSDEQLGQLLGLPPRQGPEPEHPDLALCIWPGGEAPPPPGWTPEQEVLDQVTAADPAGVANRLSQSHHEWSVIEEVAHFCVSPGGGQTPTLPPGRAVGNRRLPARPVLRGRRSAVEMDRSRSRISAEDMACLLAALMPWTSNIPLAALTAEPATHLLFFVHRVDGMAEGLYCLPRSPGAEQRLQEAMRPDYLWLPAQGVPDDVPLRLLAEGDLTDLAGAMSCGQDIAADGAFAVAMVSELSRRVEADGPRAYRQLFWEAGALGQVLYVQAEAAGRRGCGIGCYFDDAVHRFLGLQGEAIQVLYHFTVGAARPDDRLQTLPAYHHLK